MKKVFFILFSLLLSIGCSEKKNDKASEAIEDFKDQVEETADKTSKVIKNGSEDLKKKLDERLSNLDEKIDDLKAKKGSNKDIADLEAKRDELKSRFEKASNNAKENWTEFKDESRETFEEIENKIESLKK